MIQGKQKFIFEFKARKFIDKFIERAAIKSKKDLFGTPLLGLNSIEMKCVMLGVKIRTDSGK